MKGRFLLIVALLVSSSSLFAASERECEPPQEKPEIPAGGQASEAELIASQKAVKEYVAQGEFFLTCLKAREQQLGEDITEDQQQQLLASYDQTVAAMQALSESFNKALRAYKAAGAKGG